MINKYINNYDDYILESLLIDFFKKKLNALSNLFKNTKFIKFLKKVPGFAAKKFKKMNTKEREEYLKDLFPDVALKAAKDIKKDKNSDTLFEPIDKNKKLDKNTKQYIEFVDNNTKK